MEMIMIPADIKMNNTLLSDKLFNVEQIADAVDLSIHDSVSSIREEWAALEKEAMISVYQRMDWTESFLRVFSKKKGFKPFIVVGRLGDDIVFILPLAMEGRFFRRLKFVGGTHVNFNIGLISPNYAHLIGPETFPAIMEQLRQLLPGIGYMELCCQPQTWLNKPNPMLSSSDNRSGYPAYVLDLSGRFDETLARGNAKRKRKKFRQQVRYCENHGGYEFCVPKTLCETNEAIDVFFEQKSRRLREMGVRDVFGSEQTRSFLKDLARKSLSEDEPMLQLYMLKVGGKIVAVFGGGFHKKRFSGYFSSIAGEEWNQLSPGEMLLYLLVEHLCEQKCIQMDLGAGEERYKQSWSSERIEMYETIIPFSAASIPMTGARKLYGKIRRIIREDTRYWAWFKKFRKFKADFLTWPSLL